MSRWPGTHKPTALPEHRGCEQDCLRQMEDKGRLLSSSSDLHMHAMAWTHLHSQTDVYTEVHLHKEFLKGF